jgi:hypothetical protein
LQREIPDALSMAVKLAALAVVVAVLFCGGCGARSPEPASAASDAGAPKTIPSSPKSAQECPTEPPELKLPLDLHIEKPTEVPAGIQGPSPPLPSEKR